MAASLVTLLYVVLMVFLNLSYLRYEPPPDGRRLKDLGHELIPRIPPALFPFKDVPMYLIMATRAVVLAGAVRSCRASAAATPR